MQFRLFWLFYLITVIAIAVSFYARHGAIGIAVGIPHYFVVSAVVGFCSRRRLKLASFTVLTYFAAWVITLAFGPTALVKFWENHHSRVGKDLSGNTEPVEFKTGVSFVGEGFDYLPDIKANGKWWCCVGKPWCDAPFLVASEVAWIDGPFSGFAGTQWFVWTGFRLVPIYSKIVWVS